MTYEAHAASELFAPMNPRDLKKLAESIRRDGLRDPIVLFEGKVLDGRARMEACELAGVEPRFEILEACPSPTREVVARNLHRRHLTVSQRALVGGFAKARLAEEARQRQEASQAQAGQKVGAKVGATFPPPTKSGKSRDLAAAMAGVSNRTIDAACRVIESGDTEIIEAVRAGHLTVSKAQAELGCARTSQVPPGPTAIPAHIRRATPEQFLDQFELESVDLLISRPRFDVGPEHLEAHVRHWLGLAVRPMKYSSRILLLCSSALEEVSAFAAACLRHPQFEPCGLLTFANQRPKRGTAGHDYQRTHLVGFHLRGPDAKPLAIDALAERGSTQLLPGRELLGSAETLGEIAERFIRHASRPGDVVIDPSAGPGAVPLAAARLGRRGFGAARDTKHIEMARQGGCVIDE